MGWYDRKRVAFNTLKGKVLTDIEVYEGGDDFIKFTDEDGREYKMYHEQDCCENVYIEDICGDVKDLIGREIVEAEESDGEYEEASESGTWTFYRISTVMGTVTIRWIGESNGYYSESVDLVEL